MVWGDPNQPTPAQPRIHRDMGMCRQVLQYTNDLIKDESAPRITLNVTQTYPILKALGDNNARQGPGCPDLMSQLRLSRSRAHAICVLPSNTY